jgi:hypothetical protein
MEKDGDSEEDNDEEVVKQVVKRRFEGRGQPASSPSFLSILLTTFSPPSSQSSSLPLSLLPLSHPHHLSILHSSQSATSLPLFSFL